MATTYIFGPFRFDVATEILFRDTEPVALGQRAIALLRVLLERPGIPVSKDALIETAWAGLTVEKSNLAVPNPKEWSRALLSKHSHGRAFVSLARCTKRTGLPVPRPSKTAAPNRHSLCSRSRTNPQSPCCPSCRIGSSRRARRWPECERSIPICD